MNKICIIGVGLIGGSLARAVKEKNPSTLMMGYAQTDKNLKIAKKIGVLDDYSTDIQEAVSNSDLVVLATPVNAFETILENIKPFLGEQTVVTDVGSTKLNLIASAEKVFGSFPQFLIPAHPIAGKEKNGVEFSDANLFNGKRVVVTPEKNSDQNALDMVISLWEDIGAHVEVMSAIQHDSILGMTSHLPHMLAFNLVDYLMSQNKDAFNYAAGGFKDFSRIASSDHIMWRDICLNNANEITNHISGYIDNLENLSNMIKNHDSDGIDRLFLNAKQSRDNWLKKK